MRRLEILLGRLWRDCCLGEGRSADFGVCRFRIAEGTWLQIDNVWKETIHVLFPLRRIADSGKADSSKRETEISDAKLLHIAEGESAVVSGAELSESDWKECIVILCGENIVPVSLKWRKYDGSQAVNLDFLSVEPEESGIKVFSDRYGLSQIGCIQGKTFDGQAETLYSGYLGSGKVYCEERRKSVSIDPIRSGQFRTESADTVLVIRVTESGGVDFRCADLTIEKMKLSQRATLLLQKTGMMMIITTCSCILQRGERWDPENNREKGFF